MSVVVISSGGTSGPRGNTIYNGHGAPSSTLGIDGDWYIDNSTPTALVMYGPKTAGAWGSGQPFGSSGVASITAGDTSIVIGGTGTNPTVHTGTLDVIATDQPPAGDWSNNSHKITHLAVGVASTDAVNVSQLPQATPWIFDVTTAAYGAKGDGEFVTDAAMSSGSAVLTSASGLFTSNDVNKHIMVLGAGASGVTTLVTTIASFQSSTQVTLAATNASGGNVSATVAMWATDDTSAIQSAINAALSYATTHGSAVVRIPTSTGRFYGVAGSLITGGSTLGNSQLTLGAPVATSANKVILTIEGVTNGAGLQHWQQLNQQVNGSTLVSFGVFANSTAQTNSINTNGNPCVIGGPAQPGGYGTGTSVFDNKLVTLRNLSILTTHSVNGFTYSAVDFSGLAEANLENFAYGTTGSVQLGSYSSPALLGNGLSIGLLMPANGNNDNNRAANVSCHGGYTFGIFATEHFVCDRLCILYCWSGLCPVGSYFGSVGSTHSIAIQQASIEACPNVVNIIGIGSNGIGPWVFANIDTEIADPTFTDRTSGTGLNAALGTITLTGLYSPSGVNTTAPTGLNIINGQQGSPAQWVHGTTNYSVGVIDRVLLVDASTGNTTVNLLSAAWTPQVITVVRIDSTGNTLHVVANGSELINGASFVALTGQYSKVTVTPARVNSVWGWYETA